MATFHRRASELFGGKPGLFASDKVGGDAAIGFVTGRAADAAAAAAVVEGGAGERRRRRSRGGGRRGKLNGRASIIHDVILGDGGTEQGHEVPCARNCGLAFQRRRGRCCCCFCCGGRGEEEDRGTMCPNFLSSLRALVENALFKDAALKVGGRRRRRAGACGVICSCCCCCCCWCRRREGTSRRGYRWEWRGQWRRVARLILNLKRCVNKSCETSWQDARSFRFSSLPPSLLFVPRTMIAVTLPLMSWNLFIFHFVLASSIRRTSSVKTFWCRTSSSRSRIARRFSRA